MSRKRPKKIDVAGEAERLYRETGDYRYVAMAMGSNLLDPPEWAKHACRMAFWHNEQTSPSGLPADEVGALLDDMVGYFIDWQRSSDAKGRKPPSLAAAMRHAIADHGIGPESDQHEQFERKLRKAWDNEYKNGEPWRGDEPHLKGFSRVTPRMKRKLGGAGRDGLPISEVPIELSRLAATITKKRS